MRKVCNPTRTPIRAAKHEHHVLIVLFVLYLLFSLVAPASAAGDLPWKKGDEIRDGWCISEIQRHSEYVRLKLVRQSEVTTIEISCARHKSDWTTENYVVQPAPGSSGSPPPELLRAFLKKLEELEKNPFHVRLIKRFRPQLEMDERNLLSAETAGAAGARIAWHAMPTDVASEKTDFPFWDSNLLIILLILLTTALLLTRARYLISLASRIQRPEWIMLGCWTLLGALLRAYGGTRIPGFTNFFGYAHGYELLHDVLVFPAQGADPHGNGFCALYSFVLLLLPDKQSSVVVCQFTMSLLSIPLSYVVARAWLVERRAALWTAAVFACLPSVAYFATTEVRLVPGVFFMLLSLAVLGVATRDSNPLTLLAAATTGYLCTRFYPILMLYPLIAGAFILSTERGRRILRWPSAWLVAIAFLALWAWPGWKTVSTLATESDSVFGTGYFTALSALDRLVLPAVSYEAEGRYNIFINHNFTPPVFALLALVGLISGLRRSSDRYTVLAILFLALLFTLAGIFPGRMNLARLQLAAQAFWALLAGLGLAWLFGYFSRFASSLGWHRECLGWLAGAVVVLSSLLIWPGPTGRLHTVQLERLFFERAIERLDDKCVIVWPPSVVGTNHGMPSYLAINSNKTMKWGALVDASIPEPLLQSVTCVYYLRPSTCYVQMPDENRPQAIRPECARIEQELRLEEVYAQNIASVPDDAAEYHGENIRIGFYRVLGRKKTD